MERITRHLFLRDTAAVGAAVAIAAPAAAAEPEMTPREKVIWHMRELERLAKEDGAREATVWVVGRFYEPNFHCKTLAIDKSGDLLDFGTAGFFMPKGVPTLTT